MPFLSLSGSTVRQGFTRPIVQTLFVATCLLSVVSYYTTQQGMALYLAPWFAVMAALGIQVSLVMVAWLVGIERNRSPLLIGVYIITALVSISFSYVCLHNWFASRERPAEIERALYDDLNSVAGQTDTLLAEAAGKARQYVVALDEMTAAEREHGYVSTAGDADPYLDAIRQAVAKEAQAVGPAYREGSGAGVRYTAFERYSKLTGEALREIEASRRQLADWRASAKPLDPSDRQLRNFRTVFDSVPWATVEQITGRKVVNRPAVPDYAAYVDRSASSQEDLLRAFTELGSAPTARHYFALALAAFIDIVIFLLAFAAGPYFHGNPETLWSRGAAALDSVEEQVFVRGLLAKLQATPRGMTAVAVDALTPGERQFALALESSGMAVVEERDGKLFYLIDRPVQRRILESLAEPGLPLRAAARKAAAGA
jgi:hypothetical protein